MWAVALIIAGLTCGTALAQPARGNEAGAPRVADGTEAADAGGWGLGALHPAMQRMLAPAVSAWIVSARDAAIRAGVEAIPPEVRDALRGYVPDEVLDDVRWRIDDSVISVERGMFAAVDARAITLDRVVLFATAAEAANPKLWAHEIYHVLQYRDWGVDGFVERYLEDHRAVEREAKEFRWQWMKATGRVPPP